MGSSFTFALPSLGSFSAGGALAAGTAITVTGAQIAGGALASIGIMYLIPKQGGVPNSVVQQGGSTGVYDENGNLISRRDTTGKPHYIKELGDYFLPHTHVYKWKFIKGAWRLVNKFILPH